MSPIAEKRVANSNVYTAILAVVLCVILATAGLVAYKAQSSYGTFYKVMK